MSLLSGFNISFDELKLMAVASRAAFVGGAIPSGWTVITPQQLGVASTYWDGNYFTDPSSGASAIVLRQGTSEIVAFRGTDGNADVNHYSELFSGTYINHFQPLLSAVAANDPGGTNFYFTGASLGGGATNQMANIAGSAFGGHFASAKLVAFASPNISNANGILNIGAENDPVYKAINNYNDFPSTLDNLVLATPEYMAGNYDGQHPFSTYAHTTNGISFDLLSQTSFLDLLNPDSVLIVDAVANGLVQDITPGREKTGAFYVGQTLDDQIAGRAGNDYIDGFSGNDTLSGGDGNDTLHGGSGNDALNGGEGDDTLVGNDDPFATDFDALNGGNGSDTLLGQYADNVNGGPGTDFLYDVNANPWTIDLGATSIEWMSGGFGGDTINAASQTTRVDVFANGGNDVVTGSDYDDNLWGGVGDDTLSGGKGNDLLFGDLGADQLLGGEGNDTIYADSSDTPVNGGPGFDVLYWAAGSNANIDLAADSIEFAQTLGDNDTLDGALSTADLIVFAGAGTDTVTGGAGNDFLWGEAGDDKLTGNAGNDTLVGGTGADRITGGNGTDNLYGNSGAAGDGAVDTFVFTPNWGIDFVYDFEPDIDKLDLTALHLLASDVHIISANGNAQVDIGTPDLIVVVGQAGHITQNDLLL